MVSAIQARSVCVRAPNWVGDVVMATPVFRALREELPDAHITLVVKDKVADVVRGAPWFDEELVLTRTKRSFLQCVGRLRSPLRDLGVLLPDSFSSALMFRMAGVRRRVGYRRDLRAWMLTDALDRPSVDGRFRPTYMADYYGALCELVGVPVRSRELELHYSARDAARARAVLADAGVDTDGPLFLLHPGAGFGPSKCWVTERYARVAEGLVAAHGGQAAVIGVPAEAPLAREVADAAGVPVVSLCTSAVDLHVLKGVVAGSRLLVTTDSGPRHYGVALGVPTVCLMGPTHPGYSTSSWPNDHVVRVEVDCGPCQRRDCPTDHRCMELITADMVLEACERALRRATSAAGAGPMPTHGADD